MKCLKTFVTPSLATMFLVVVCGMCSHAAVIPFILDGNAGLGLLPGNENPPVASTGSGGIGAGGILYDTASKLISIDVRWGSGNGFSDLTSTATVMHIHLATANAAPAGFSDNAGASVTLNTLAGFNPSATAGSLIDTAGPLSAAQEAALLGNRSYINVHSIQFGGGELRGHLVVVPEPTSCVLLLGMGVSILLGSSRNRVDFG